MWATLQAGKSWMGLVKNRCKNGDHYWVSAFVTPVYENGNIVGYESVRIAAQDHEKERALGIYHRLQENKSPVSMMSKAASLLASVYPIWLIGILLAIGAGVAYGVFAGLFALMASLVMLSWQGSVSRAQWKGLLALSPASYSNDIVAQTYYQDVNYIAQAKLVPVSYTHLTLPTILRV